MDSIDFDFGSNNDTNALIGNLNSPEESQVELTPLEVIQILEKAWMNELHSPELLEPKMDEVNCLLDQINLIEENLERLEKSDFSISIRKMELSRIRFMIASYLRLRLQKIQKHAHYLSKRSNDELDSKLTTEEATFLEKYRENIDKLFANLALDHIPDKAGKKSFSNFGETSNNQPDPPMPNLNSAVFVKAEENIQGVFVEDEAGQNRDEEFDMEKDHQYILRYKSVSHLIRNGSVKMI